MTYPDFIHNDRFYQMDQSQDPQQQLVAMTENIKRVHNLTTKHYDDFNQLIKDYLLAGIEIFQLSTGIVSHITTEQAYIVKDVVTDFDVINPGDVYELEGTYCREVYHSHRTIGFPHVGELEELKDHPVYVNLKLESYISAPIYVNGVIYGTLNFSSTKPREYGFSEHEHDLISMMAQAIGNFIVLQEREEHLKSLNFRMKELIGHVAHDLRNPLGAIQGLAQIGSTRELQVQQQQDMFLSIHDEANSTLDFVNRILDEAALGTGKVKMNFNNFDFNALLNKALESYKTLIQDENLTFDISHESECSVYADEGRIIQVLKNLINNAAKYAQKGSTIAIECRRDENSLHFSMKNMKATTENELDTILYKSIGFGMEIIEEILRQHGSALEISEEADSFEASFSLPLC